jgi:hypothetical protein
MNRGIALPVVLFALALSSALAVGGVYVTRQVAASARAAQRGAALETMSEGALVDAVSSWDSLARAQQAVGAVAALPTSSVDGVESGAWVTRIGASAYWLVAQSTSSSRPVLRRRIGLLIWITNGVPKPVPQRAWGELP